ncbi:MAG TPA: sigma-70 family RNA polymerase sigma factor [Acidobacteriaceae bacterium]|nr:sigma-70 family RNA polymerase sigma factor [Acidobacteriaceae bacterium]
MNADALSLEAGGELAPVPLALPGTTRRKRGSGFASAVPKSPLLRAAVSRGALAAANPRSLLTRASGALSPVGAIGPTVYSQGARGALATVESSAAMPKAAAQSGQTGTRKLTQAQLEARAQQRSEDDDLIREAQRGDRTAFDALVRRYDQSVLRLALHMLGNEQDAQDVHQEAFLKAYRHLGNFRFECSFYTWLYRIVTNLCLDHLRRRKSRREDAATVVDVHGEEMDLMANVSDTRAMANPARELDRKRMGERINEALSKLTPRERMVFELKHYQGLKLRTIGEMLSTTEETAKNTLFRATRKLRANLAELKGQ